MRPTIRPFKIEFKNRASRSMPMRSPTSDETGKECASRSFSDATVFTPTRNTHSTDYEAALRAADAVFAVRAPVIPAIESNPAPKAPLGRVLPSLIESNEDSLAARLANAEEKPRVSRGKAKIKAPSARRQQTPAVQAKAAAAPVPALRPIATIPPEIDKVSPPVHERRSVQKLRLLDAELKAGERWKRRLCKAAR